MNRLIRMSEVCARTGQSRSTIYDRIKQQQFPAGIGIGGRNVAWLESDIEAWIQARVAEARGHAA